MIGVRAPDMKAAPVFDFERVGGGTGFFYEQDGTCYLVTAKHNFVEMDLTKTNLGEGEEARYEVEWGEETDCIWVFVNDDYPVDVSTGFEGIRGNRIALRESASYTESIPGKQYPARPVFTNSKWDIAVIELSSFWPRKHGFEVFSEVGEPSFNDTLHITGLDYDFKNGIINGRETTDGVVGDALVRAAVLDDQVLFETEFEVIKEGYSGSPLYDDDGTLYGIQTTINELPEEADYGEFPHRTGFYPASRIRELITS